MVVEQRHIVQLAGSVVNRLGRLELGGIHVGDALSQRLARRQRSDQCNRETKRLHSFFLPFLKMWPRPVLRWSVCPATTPEFSRDRRGCAYSRRLYVLVNPFRLLVTVKVPSSCADTLMKLPWS